MIAVGSGRGRHLPGVTQTLSRPLWLNLTGRKGRSWNVPEGTPAAPVGGSVRRAGPQTSCFSDFSSQKPRLMDTLRTRRPLEMVVLLALLIAIGLSWVPTAGAEFYGRFYMSSKQCSRFCPVRPDETIISSDGAPQPKPFVAQKPLPFLYARCCKWDLCNNYGPPIPQFKEQPGKASERRYRYTELFLPGFMVLDAPGLTDLSLL
ncbi:lymphocyte antigen 6K [Microtus oregoni]|uniref:lymphocyte antigen 6K n=1 Tax=Microtus oregoni TaxID=111838 RepID=UPI001BB1CE60|nr:lymphocyte antigen 6K [Microtus oregoni]